MKHLQHEDTVSADDGGLITSMRWERCERNFAAWDSRRERSVLSPRLSSAMVMEKASHPVVSYGKALRMDGADYPTLRAQLSRRFVSLPVRLIAREFIFDMLSMISKVFIIQALPRHDTPTSNFEHTTLPQEQRRKKGKKE